MPAYPAKVVSFVPSLTETFLHLQMNVVGRTRFCIHPQPLVSNIPVVGGTKDFSIEKVLKLKPDLVVLDQEENKKELHMALVQAGLKVFVFHVKDLKSLRNDFEKLNELLNLESIRAFCERVRSIDENRATISMELFFRHGLVQDFEPLKQQIFSTQQNGQFEYLIWKNPWMGIGAGTFICDVMSFGGVFLQHDTKYPILSDEALKNKFLFFSTEPFPFEKQMGQLYEQGLRGALIDGEKISWYGIRTLLFLESCRYT